MEKLIVANWKMNNDFTDIPKFVKFLKKNAKKEKGLVVCVPSVMIHDFSKAAKGVAETGAENCHFAEKGAFTGEISAKMVKSAGANYVIVGHSERRHIFGEDDAMLNKKLIAALAAGLKVIFCVGETLDEKSKYKSVLKTQLTEGLKGVSNFENVVIAYEPVWAIGTGKVATTDDIKKVHGYVANVLKSEFNVELPILYGGSVKSSNSGEILALDCVGGVLIGGASLKAEEYVAIAQSR